VNSEMHLKAVIERVWRCTWRTSWGEFEAAHRGRNRASLAMHLEVVYLEAVDREKGADGS
jgi:hypothetical protein